MDQVGLIEKVERVLVKLYPDTGAFRRLAGNAKLNVPGLDFGGEYNSVLNDGLRRAEDQGKLDDILNAAMRDYEDNSDLLLLADDIKWTAKSPADRVATSAKELHAFLISLRGCRHLTRRELSKLDDKLQRTFELIETEESDRGNADAPGPWYDLDQNLQRCVGRLQLYRALLTASVKPARGRSPGAPEERRTLAEVAADESTLIDAKQDLYNALTSVVQSCRDLDRDL